MRNRQANAPLKLWTAAKDVAAMPNTNAHTDRTLAIRVRLARSANGTTGRLEWNSSVQPELTERGVANKVERVEQSVSVTHGIATDVVHQTQGFGVTKVRLVEGRTHIQESEDGKKKQVKLRMSDVFAVVVQSG